MIFVFIAIAYLLIGFAYFLKLVFRNAYQIAAARTADERYENKVKAWEDYEAQQAKAWEQAKAEWYLPDYQQEAYDKIMRGFIRPDDPKPETHVNYSHHLACSIIWPFYYPVARALRKAEEKALTEEQTRVAEVENLRMLRSASQDEPEVVAAIDSFAKTRGLNPLDLSTSEEAHYA